MPDASTSWKPTNELAAVSAVHVTLDYQWAQNPAYNRDRGPVSIFAVRVHAAL